MFTGHCSSVVSSIEIDTIMRRQLCERVEDRIERMLSFPLPVASNDEDVLFRAHSGADDISVIATTDRRREIIVTAQMISAGRFAL